jgi:23S rRNA (uracil1939-C5)-methyltransferase
MISSDEELELEIERMGIYGEGVARWNNFTIFVEAALPGERVRVRLYEKRSTFARGRILSLLRPSPHRVRPPCRFFGTCGGCQIMHWDISKQLEIKRQRVIDALERIGGISVEVMPCEPSPLALGYRNKIQLPVVSRRMGLYALNSRDLVEIDSCLIHCSLGEEAFQAIRKILALSPDPPLLGLKHILIKTGVYTEQVCIILVTESKTPMQKLAHDIVAAMPRIKGIVQNVQPRTSNTVLGADFYTLFGQGWIEERLLGLSFKVSPGSFFQVNSMQAETLYSKVSEFAALQGSEKVLDAYCGVGTLSLILARQAREVVGIEVVPQAIADARDNAERNGISNVDFLCGKAEDLIGKWRGTIDIAVLNPPRKGCEPVFLKQLILLSPRNIVYISCDPATLARDLRFLCSQGYSVERVQPLDMFPQTSHVECLVKLIFA